MRIISLVVLASFRMSECYLFREYSEKYQKGESIIYEAEGYPYIYSCLLKPDDHTSGEQLRERMRNYALDRLIEVSKITKLKNMSPHDIIENEYKK